MNNDVYSTHIPTYNVKKMKRSLCIAVLLLLTAIISSSYDSSVLEIKSNSTICSTPFCASSCQGVSDLHQLVPFKKELWKVNLVS